MTAQTYYRALHNAAAHALGEDPWADLAAPDGRTRSAMMAYAHLALGATMGRVAEHYGVSRGAVQAAVVRRVRKLETRANVLGWVYTLEGDLARMEGALGHYFSEHSGPQGTSCAPPATFARAATGLACTTRRNENARRAGKAHHSGHRDDRA